LFDNTIQYNKFKVKNADGTAVTSHCRSCKREQIENKIKANY